VSSDDRRDLEEAAEKNKMRILWVWENWCAVAEPKALPPSSCALGCNSQVGPSSTLGPLELGVCARRLELQLRFPRTEYVSMDGHSGH
jgi:hypothetical protein